MTTVGRPAGRRKSAARRLDAGDRYDELLAAAHGLAVAGGLGAVTPADVARATGASKALVFHYFGSTAALRRAVAEVAIDTLATTLAATDAIEDRTDLVGLLVDAALAEKHLWSDIWTGALHGDAATSGLLDDVRDLLTERIARFRPELAAPDASSEDRLVVSGWIGFVEAVLVRWFVRHEGSRDAVVHAIVRSVDALFPRD